MQIAAILSQSAVITYGHFATRERGAAMVRRIGSRYFAACVVIERLSRFSMPCHPPT